MIVWRVFEDGDCCCGEHHAEGVSRPAACDGCGRAFTAGAVAVKVLRQVKVCPQG